MNTKIIGLEKEEVLTEETDMYIGYKVSLSKRPKRDAVIGKEDILNLRINLETSKSLEAFLKKVFKK